MTKISDPNETNSISCFNIPAILLCSLYFKYLHALDAPECARGLDRRRPSDLPLVFHAVEPAIDLVRQDSCVAADELAECAAGGGVPGVAPQVDAQETGVGAKGAGEGEEAVAGDAVVFQVQTISVSAQ